MLVLAGSLPYASMLVLAGSLPYISMLVLAGSLSYMLCAEFSFIPYVTFGREFLLYIHIGCILGNKCMV